jgi:hypothetical protein
LRKAAWILAVVLLLVTGIFGLVNAVLEQGDQSSLLQSTVWLGVMTYGALGVVAGIGLALRRPWSATVAAAWAITVTYVATVASFAYHDPTFSQNGTVTGTVAAGCVTALIGWFIVWAARSATRAPSLPRAAATGHIPSP